MANVVVTVIIAVMLFAAIRYIIKAKKSGVKCIGCPAAGQCASKADPKAAQECSCGCESGNSSCGCH